MVIINRQSQDGNALSIYDMRKRINPETRVVDMQSSVPGITFGFSCRQVILQETGRTFMTGGLLSSNEATHCKEIIYQ